MFTSVGLTLLCLALVPLYILAVALFGLYSFVGLATGLLPLAHHCLLRRDRRRLAGLLTPHKGAVIEMVAIEEGSQRQEQQEQQQSTSSRPPRRLAVRWSPGTKGKGLPPVVIANGLGATLLTIASLVRQDQPMDRSNRPLSVSHSTTTNTYTHTQHDLLEAVGFPVLSFDRAGVGLSDPAPPTAPSTGRTADDDAAAAAAVERTVADMKYLMDRYYPVEGEGGGGDDDTITQWIVVGLSMGSVVGQCLIAQHPEAVGGFVNVDGVPFPFGAKKDKFHAAAQVYCLLACVSQTGLLRLPLALFGPNSAALRQAATPPRFPLPILLAQMQDASFFASIAQEMPLMLALCDAAARAWGPAFDLARLDSTESEALANAAPAACGDVSDAGGEGAGRWAELPRAVVERGGEWAAEEATRGVLARLLARAASSAGAGAGEEAPTAAVAPLWLVWQRLSVRVLSARCYDFGLASGWYDPGMQALAAAEHSLHARLAGDGRRVVFPRRSHAKMFFGVQGFVVEQVREVAASMAAQQRRGP